MKGGRKKRRKAGNKGGMDWEWRQEAKELAGRNGHRPPRFHATARTCVQSGVQVVRILAHLRLALVPPHPSRQADEKRPGAAVDSCSNGAWLAGHVSPSCKCAYFPLVMVKWKTMTPVVYLLRSLGVISTPLLMLVFPLVQLKLGEEESDLVLGSVNSIYPLESNYYLWDQALDCSSVQTRRQIGCVRGIYLSHGTSSECR